MPRILPLNEHQIERVLRIVAGVVLLALVVVGPKTLWGLVGIVPLATGLVGSCPIYHLLGLSTSQSREAH
jgi:hypothetical protein